jgi:hypothetical protein
MGRKRRRGRHGKARGGGGGALTRLRGGFRSTTHAVVGAGNQGPESRLRRTVVNVITIGAVVAAALILLRRFGILH